MTDTAPPPAAVDLGELDGYPVIGSAVKITKAGDGLSKALGVQPRRIHKGEKLLLLLEVEAGPVMFRPAEEVNGWIRVDTLEATGVAFVPAGMESEVRARLVDLAEKIKVAQEAARGVNRLPVGEAFEKAHEAGDHAAGLVPGCPTCQAEVDAAAREAEDDLEPAGDDGDWPTVRTDAPPPPPPATDGTVSTLAGRSSRRRNGKAAASE